MNPTLQASGREAVFSTRMAAWANAMSSADSAGVRFSGFFPVGHYHHVAGIVGEEIEYAVHVGAAGDDEPVFVAECGDHDEGVGVGVSRTIGVAFVHDVVHAVGRPEAF